jgi:hypothetical protein
MKTSDQINEIAAAMAKAQTTIQQAHKDKENDFFKSSYADLASVWDACRLPLSENGIAVFQMPTTTAEGAVAVTTCLAHSSGQWIEETMACKPAKGDAQAMGSVVTYLRRYMLAAAAGVAPADDDGNAAVKGGDKNAEKVDAVEPPKDEWHGPLNKTAFKNKVGDMARALNACKYHEEVTDITDEFHDLIEQMKVDRPDWWKGKDDIVGMETKLATAKKSLPSIEDSTSEESA